LRLPTTICWIAIPIAIAGVIALRSQPAPTSPDARPEGPTSRPEPPRLGSAIAPLPTELDLDEDRVALGRRLFHEPRLSRDGTISCATCHDLEKGGVDGRRVSIGIDGAEGDVNAPTVFNSSLNFRQFWDGRAETLEEQVSGPLEHPKEMGSSWDEAIRWLAADAEYAREFAAAYPDGATAETVKHAIAEFERSLITPNSRFDRYLRGEADVLTADEVAGWELFQELGCITCHQGVNIGGNAFQTLGVMGNYFADRGDVTTADLGRFNVTKKERDKHRFKVPSLRNVALTAPYFHDGEAETLEEAVQIMARYQLGFELEAGELRHLVAFLATLTGEYEAR
jgi:cytochrome c peroxidase